MSEIRSRDVCVNYRSSRGMASTILWSSTRIVTCHLVDGVLANSYTISDFRISRQATSSYQNSNYLSSFLSLMILKAHEFARAAKSSMHSPWTHRVPEMTELSTRQLDTRDARAPPGGPPLAWRTLALVLSIGP